MAFFRRSLVGLLLLAFTGYTLARVATQKAYGICIKDNTQNRLSLKFTLDLQSDPVGSLEVYNPPTGLACSFPLVTNSRYERTVNLDGYGLGTPSPASGESGCGYSYQVTNGAVTWEFIYYELANRHDVDLGLNRIYTVTCDVNNIVENEIKAEISVSTPDLNQNPNPYKPNLQYFIEKETSPGSNVFEPVGSTAVPVQTNLKLVLQYLYGTFDGNKYNSIAGLTTSVSPNLQHTAARAFLLDTGCPTGSLSPTTGFTVKTTNAGTYRLETSVFPAFRFDARTFNFVYFKTKVSFCVSLTDSYCNNPCSFSTTGKRRRRAADNEIEEILTAQVKIVDNLDNTETEEQKDGETLLFAALGACIAICVLLTILLCVYLFVVRRRRNNPENKLQGFDNKNFNGPK